eukprot:Pompholyxophrys_sp_v1_NODE_244_length_993_cov_1.844350.p1 type:complete len:216 gc:universal NODE_244_length_993_cov_1.844350:768-121(-)
MICPSHQLKNMVNAMESSQKNRTKNFMFDEMTSINWQHIYQTFYRELDRARTGKIRHVPKLTVDALQRDSWSKMDVGLAKIFVHGELASEIISYMVEEKNFEAVKTVELLKHLEAVFTETFLNSKRRIYNIDDVAFEQIESADDFLLRWRHNVEVFAEKLELAPEAKKQIVPCMAHLRSLACDDKRFHNLLQRFFCKKSWQTKFYQTHSDVWKCH